MSLFSRNSNSRLNPAQPDICARLFHRSHHHDPATQESSVDITAVGIGQAVPVGYEQYASSDIPDDISRAPGAPHGPHHTHGNTFPDIAEPVSAPVATQFQGAQGFNISGHPRFTNIGMLRGNVTTINYGGTHGLERLEKSVSFAALHESAEQDPTRRCHPGTRQNVLSQLRDWFDNPNIFDPICWLHGPAGAGKSAIAQTIADEYKERGVAATFFYRSDVERNDGNRLFPTLAWQLAFSIPAIKAFIVHALDKTPHLPKKAVESQFEQLVAHPFHPMNNIDSQIPQPAPVVIIDGVDECSDEQLQRRILAVIGNAVKECLVPLRFLVCSRPEALIEEIFDQFIDITLRIDLATLDDSNRDIEKYLVDQFSDIASKRGLVSTWPGPEILEEFVFKSSGNFIFAATVMRYISDDDGDPEEQLDIVRNLKPRGKMSPFALLDELYLEILKRQRDPDFLKTFLALLVGRSSINTRNLHKDDATLLNVSEKNLHMKLRRMRSLLKFEPFIDVYHKSFFDFLQDLSRSAEYHVSRQGGQKRYLELIVDFVVRHFSMVIEQPNGHEECRPSPKYTFGSIVKSYPPTIVLPVKDWQEAIKPLLHLQDKLLNALKPQPCHISQVMRGLLLHLAILQGDSHYIAPAPVLDSNPDETVTKRSATLVTGTGQDNDLGKCLSVLLSCLPNADSVLAVDTVIIERMSFLLAFDCAETAARVLSVTDAQKLIDLIGLLINNEPFLDQCGRDAARKAALLTSEIYARVPLLPRSLFLNRPTGRCEWFDQSSSSELEYLCQRVFISKILDHNHILPSWIICQEDELKFVQGSVNEEDESVDKWLKRSSPDFVTRMRVMLEVARAIQYIHSMGTVVALWSNVIRSKTIALDSNLRAKVMCCCFFAWHLREKKSDHGLGLGYLTSFTHESNISAFAELFHWVCFDSGKENLPNSLVEDAKQLIERCRTKDAKKLPTMEDVVKEMETWNLP